MRIILVTDYFYPISQGGTEKYVYLLTKHLPKEYIVTILSIDEKKTCGEYKGINIDYIQPNSDSRKEVIKGILPPNNLIEFTEFINTKRPDIIHFHTLTTNFNEYHFKICFDAGIKTYFTSHIPGHQCLRGDFIYHGKEPCDGQVERRKCIECISLYNSSPILEKVTKYIYYSIIPNDPVRLKLKQLKAIQEHTDKIIAVCQWQKEFFIKNGICEKHLEICRQEVSSRNILKIQNTNKIRLGFIGRVDPVKGLHLLINALNINKSLDFHLEIAGIHSSNENYNYYKKLVASAKEIDCKWNFNLNRKQMDAFFENIDYLVIPSVWYETGPFVAYEALTANTPILATNLGGLKELVVDGENGYLFEANEDSLIDLLEKIVKKPVLQINNVRHYHEEAIAQKMIAIYNYALDK